MIALPHQLEGERRKLEGMTLAALRKRHPIVAGQLALLDAIAASPDGTATIDDGTADLGDAFADGGKWRGSVAKELAMLRLIAKAGVVLSTRPARHRGYVTRWTCTNRARLDAHRAELRRWLAANPLPSIDDGSLFDSFTTNEKPPAATGGAH